MKHRVKNLVGFSMGAIDGEIGTVKEFFFDDESWTIRYFIVETGNWFSGNKVIISPEAVINTDYESEIFYVNITKEQIKNSPAIDTEKPVSRQHELKLFEHYLWTGYWGSSIWAGGMGTAGMGIADPEFSKEPVYQNDENSNCGESDDPHLRSTNKVTDYSIKTADGKIGELHDFIIDDTTWKIEFLIIDTGHWSPGKKVIISPKLIKNIHWNSSSLIVNASTDDIKNSPELDDQQINKL